MLFLVTRNPISFELVRIKWPLSETRHSASGGWGVGGCSSMTASYQSEGDYGPASVNDARRNHGGILLLTGLGDALPPPQGQALGQNSAHGAVGTQEGPHRVRRADVPGGIHRLDK